MTTSPSDTEATNEGGPLLELAEAVAGVLDNDVEPGVDHGSARLRVPPERWVEAVTAARDQGLVYLSWLSAIDWSNEVEVGDPPPEEVEERIEVLCAVSDLDRGQLLIISTDIPSDRPEIDTVVGVFAGANWHEREAHEMFGIEFRGHPNQGKLYLPEQFEGNPLRKSFPLLTREVKPWPGKVDVEGMPAAAEQPATSDGPTEENPEA
ncbi:MAG TPA: NADH-quinone oxidoreductase subunit C [Acidimicrobiia bacterium]|nr:NADH-quinone oxidoreductase subunit C [Acidimicrobiia bacterium]